MKSFNDMFEDVKGKVETLKPNRAQVQDIHQHLRRMIDPLDATPPDMKSVEDFSIPGPTGPIKVRLFVPFDAPKDPGPAMLYFHGGGFVTGSIESHETLCMRMANDASIPVLSVDYRLAPEHPYPAAPDDCEAVTNWALEGLGLPFGLAADQIILGGDSAGGNLAAYLVQKYRSDLAAQILFYPLLQLITVKPPNPGPQDFIPLGTMALKYIKESYVCEADPLNLRLSPILENNLKGIPPTYIMTCGLDPIRDEGKAYAHKLQAAGVKVGYSYEKTMPHGFLNFAKAFPKARRIPQEVGDFLRNNVANIT